MKKSTVGRLMAMIAAFGYAGQSFGTTIASKIKPLNREKRVAGEIKRAIERGGCKEYCIENKTFLARSRESAERKFANELKKEQMYLKN